MAKRRRADDRLTRLFDLLERAEVDETVVTSVRQPARLREALKVAVDLGLDETANDAAVAALRDRLDTFAQRLALDAHYEAHPKVRPSLADQALAAARLDGDPLAERPELLARAAREVAALRPDASADDVLLYATALERAARTA
jgi:hypothetical protein